jgi:hypothetical protein
LIFFRYPIHLAILGGNVKLVEWLASDRSSLRKRGKKAEGPILTSKGRLPLSIALLHHKLDIVRYLVADKGMSLFEEKPSNGDFALANFTSLLKMLPGHFIEGKMMESTVVPNSATALSASVSFYSHNSSPNKERRPSL